MKIMWFSVSALALCIAAPAAIQAHEAQPAPTAAQYQDRDHDWDRPPDAYQDAQRRGFHDGMEAARNDFQDRRRADADDHRAYKNPPVEGDHARHDYREGFKEGYQRAMDHMKHGEQRPY